MYTRDSLLARGCIMHIERRGARARTRHCIDCFCMWEIIKGNAFQVSSLCDNNETLIKFPLPRIVHKSRTNSLYETIRNVRTRVRTLSLFRCKREIERSRSAFCIEKCGCFLFFLIVPRHRQSWMDRRR
ncbi:hypothetical protein PUN28_009203 [Cardiocondyla obscurior]|uniref:Uncharacterized protein n=1 Tax=Cardiocondyla obscurior TaxID=286306 RepID=A0AAW2FWP3_9HYME